MESEEQAKLDAALKDLTAAVEERDALQKQLSDSQDMIGKQGTEIGDLRKSHSELGEKVSGLEKNVVEPRGGAAPVVATIESLESQIAEDEWPAVNERYNRLDSADPAQAELQRSIADRTSEHRRLYLEEYLRERDGGTRVPDSLRPDVKMSVLSAEEQMRQLFQTQVERSTYVPPGSANGSSVLRLPDTASDRSSRQHEPVGGIGVLQSLEQER